MDFLIHYVLKKSQSGFDSRDFFPPEKCDLHRDTSRTFEKLARDLVKWDSQQVVSDESIKAWKEREHKRRYAHSYKQMELINERRRKEREQAA